MTLFTGLSAFPLTPTDDEERPKPDLLGWFLERIGDAGADSIGLLGKHCSAALDATKRPGHDGVSPHARTYNEQFGSSGGTDLHPAARGHLEPA